MGKGFEHFSSSLERGKRLNTWKEFDDSAVMDKCLNALDVVVWVNYKNGIHFTLSASPG